MAKSNKKDSEDRMRLIVINNPENHDVTWESLQENILKFKPIYYCISHEIGLKKKTPHFHAFIVGKSPIRFSTLKRRFPTCDVEDRKGNASQCRDYVLKIGIWEGTDKADTQVKCYEWGELPKTAQEKRSSDKAWLLQAIKDGKSNLEIIEENDSFIYRIKDIENIRQAVFTEKYSKEFRNVETTFIFGDSATYKTSYVFSKYDAKDIFRIYNYKNLNSLWDGYSGQSVILFDEYNGQIPIELMLILTDKFPILNLSARYNNKIAMYTKIYFCSNTNFDDVYKYEKLYERKTYGAWVRRIQNVYEFKKDKDGNLEVIKHKEERKEDIVYEFRKEQKEINDEENL